MTFFVSLSGFAVLTPKPMAPGLYSFKNFQVAAKKRFEIVYASNSAGSERVQQLRSKNYICTNQGREIYLCSAFLSVQDAQNEIAARVENYLSSLKLKIEPALGEATLISEAESLTEWSMPQEVSFHNQVYPGYRYLQTATNSKIFLGSPAEETFLTEPNGKIHYSYSLSVTESKTVYLKYLVLGEYGL